MGQKLGPMIGNDVHQLLLKYEPSQPLGGTVINQSQNQKCPTDGEICLSKQRHNITETETYYNNRNNSKNKQ